MIIGSWALRKVSVFNRGVAIMHDYTQTSFAIEHQYSVINDHKRMAETTRFTTQF